MAAHYSLYIGSILNSLSEVANPLFFGMGIHPRNTYFDRGMVHGDDGWSIAILGKCRSKPFGAHVTKSAAVTSLFHGVEHYYPHTANFQRILHETICDRKFRKLSAKIASDIMVTKTHMNGKTTDAKSICQLPVACSITMFSQITCGNEQVGSIWTIVQMPQHLIKALAVELARIIRLKAQMDVRNLSD